MTAPKLYCELTVKSAACRVGRFNSSRTWWSSCWAQMMLRDLAGISVALKVLVVRFSFTFTRFGRCCIPPMIFLLTLPPVLGEFMPGKAASHRTCAGTTHRRAVGCSRCAIDSDDKVDNPYCIRVPELRKTRYRRDRKSTQGCDEQGRWPWEVQHEPRPRVADAVRYRFYSQGRSTCRRRRALSSRVNCGAFSNTCGSNQCAGVGGKHHDKQLGRQSRRWCTIRPLQQSGTLYFVDSCARVSNQSCDPRTIHNGMCCSNICTRYALATEASMDDLVRHFTCILHTLFVYFISHSSKQ